MRYEIEGGNLPVLPTMTAVLRSALATSKRKGIERMKRKLMAFGLLTAMMLSGCGAQGSAETNPQDTVPHTHEPAQVYSWNGTEHWHDCACGEKLDAAAHNVGEDLMCADCGLEIWDLGDGYVDVTGCDEYGNVCAMASYDPDGNILSSTEYRYTYDELGNIMRCECYSDGVRQSLDEYVMTEDGTTRILSYSYFYEGETDYNEYDEYGNMVYYAHYNADQVVTHESWTEYAIDDNGDYYECREISVYEDGMKIEAEYNQYEETTLRRIYDADGNLASEDVWEYGYNEDGKMEWMKEYRDGILIREVLNFAVFTDEWDITSRYPENVIEYYDDGSKLVIFNGPNTEPETETMYDADGSVSSVRRYVYETFDNGNWKRIQVYQDDVLVLDTEYVMDADNSWSRKAAMTEYLDDGTKIIIEYDENEEIISQKQYDADGNEI